MSILSGPVQLTDGGELDTSSTAKHKIGTMAVTTDGRVYRYTEAGAVNLGAGKLCVAQPIVANHENMSVQAAAAVGATSVTVTLGATAAAANDYANGYLTINDAAGEGVTYLVTGHPAADANATLTLSLAQPVKVALTTSSQASLQMNPWKESVISVTDQLDMPIGIPNQAITATEFGWIQTRGVCSALADETLAIGADLTIGTSVAGAVEVVDAAGEPRVGYAIQAGVDTEHRAIYLQID
jgi:hypothetical protein|tara:strand:+ start:4353 stop:5075 length:723 start_codon:yes stop_codon:yes gene_type:complete